MRSLSPGASSVGVGWRAAFAVAVRMRRASTRFSASRRALEVFLAVVERVDEHRFDRLVVEPVAAA